MLNMGTTKVVIHEINGKDNFKIWWKHTSAIFVQEKIIGMILGEKNDPIAMSKKEKTKKVIKGALTMTYYIAWLLIFFNCCNGGSWNSTGECRNNRYECLDIELL